MLFVLNLLWNFLEDRIVFLKFLVLPSELSIFYEIYPASTWLFVRTKLVSRCRLTAVRNKVNRHDVLQLLLIISYMNQSDSKYKEA